MEPPIPEHGNLTLSFKEYASSLSESIILEEEKRGSFQGVSIIVAEYKVKGTSGYGKIAIWYDEVADREYILDFYTDIRNDLTKLYLETFQGH